MKKMKAARITGKRTHEIISMDVPSIDEFEVLVEVILCGLCASELHNWEHGVSGITPIMGHEVVGIVAEKGKYVTNVNVGDRVTGYILNGFAEYAKAHHTMVVKVPDVLEDPEAIGEPIGCLVSGIRQTPIKLGSKAAVIGLGYMGLGFMQLLNIQGVSDITAMDIRDEAIENAKRLGADRGINVLNVPESLKVIEYGKNMDGGFGTVVEASGTQPGIDLAGELTALHGVMSVVGFHQGAKRSIDMELWNWKAIDVVNAHERRDHFLIESIQIGLDLIAGKRMNVKDMITHSYTLEDIDKGFTDFQNKVPGFIKGYIKIKE